MAAHTVTARAWAGAAGKDAAVRKPSRQARKARATAHACACSSVCDVEATLKDASACFDPIARCVPRVRWYTPPRDVGRPADALNYSLALLDWNTVYRISDLARARGERFRLDSMIILCEPRYRGTLLRDALARVSRLNGTSMSSLDHAAVEAAVAASTEGGGQLGHVRLLGKTGPNGVTIQHGLMARALVELMRDRLERGQCEAAPAHAVVVYTRLGDAVDANYIEPLLERLDLELEATRTDGAHDALVQPLLPHHHHHHHVDRGGGRKSAAAATATATPVREVVISGVLNYATNPLRVRGDSTLAYAHRAEMDRLSADVVDRLVQRAHARGLRASVRSEPDADRDLCYYVLSPHVVTGTHGGFPLFVQLLRRTAGLPIPAWEGKGLYSTLPKHACACARACAPWERATVARCVDPLRRCGTAAIRWWSSPKRNASTQLGYQLAVVAQQGAYRVAEILLSRGPKWRLDATRVLCGAQFRGTALRDALAKASKLDGVLSGSWAPSELERVLGNRTEGPTRWPGHALLQGRKGENGLVLRTREIAFAMARELRARLRARACTAAPPDALAVYMPVGDGLGVDPAALAKKIDVVLAELRNQQRAIVRSAVLLARIALPAALDANASSELDSGGFSASAMAERTDAAVAAVDALVAHVRARGLHVSVHSEPDVDRLLCVTTFSRHLVTAELPGSSADHSHKQWQDVVVGNAQVVPPSQRRRHQWHQAYAGEDTHGGLPHRTEQLFTEMLWRLRRAAELTSAE